MTPLTTTVNASAQACSEASTTIPSTSSSSSSSSSLPFTKKHHDDKLPPSIASAVYDNARKSNLMAAALSNDGAGSDGGEGASSAKEADDARIVDPVRRRRRRRMRRTDTSNGLGLLTRSVCDSLQTERVAGGARNGTGANARDDGANGTNRRGSGGSSGGGGRQHRRRRRSSDDEESTMSENGGPSGSRALIVAVTDQDQSSESAKIVADDVDLFRSFQANVRSKGVLTVAGVEHVWRAALRSEMRNAALAKSAERKAQLAQDAEWRKRLSDQVGCLDVEILEESFSSSSFSSLDDAAGQGADAAAARAGNGSRRRQGWGIKSFASKAITSLLTEQASSVKNLGGAGRWNPNRPSRVGEEGPFARFPSRDTALNYLVQSLSDAEGGMVVTVSIEGGAFLGKSRLVREAIRIKVNARSRIHNQDEGAAASYTVLESFRTSLDSCSSYFAFRPIALMALRKCAALQTRHYADADDDDDDVMEVYTSERDGESTINDLVDAGLLTDTDRAMLGMIVPDIMDEALLGLIQGKTSTVLVKDAAATLLKLFVPLQPLALVFEGDGEGDFDAPSWDLLSHLIEVASEQCSKMCILLESRDDLPFPTAISEDVRRIRLQPLSIDETELHVKTVMGIADDATELDQNLVDDIFERTGGCPLFAERLVQWAKHKELFDYDRRTDVISLRSPDRNEDGASDAAGVLPSDLILCVLEAYKALDHKLWDVLKIASCLGRSFDPREYEMLDRNMGFMACIRDLEKKHDVFERLSTGRYRWKQQIVFESIKSVVMTEEQSDIHNMILRTFGSYMEKADPILLARHSAQAGRWEDAVTLYVEAGTRAEDSFQFAEAENYFAQAIECQRNVGGSRRMSIGGSHSIKVSLLPKIKRGDCLRELARYEEAEGLLSWCLEKARAENNSDELLQVLAALATLKQATSCYEEARTLYEDALSMARATDGSRTNIWMARHVARYGEILRKSGRLHDAESFHKEALDLRLNASKEKKCTELELAVSYTQLGCTVFGLGQIETAHDHHRRALAIRVKTLDFDNPLCSESLNYCAECLHSLNKGRLGIPYGIHAVQIRKKAFGPMHPAYAHALSVLASCYRSIGRSCDAIKLLEECNTICEVAFSKLHANLIPNLISYGEALQSVGRFVEALTSFEQAALVHKHNFEEGQNSKQLERIDTAIKGALALSSNKGEPVLSSSPTSGSSHLNLSNQSSTLKSDTNICEDPMSEHITACQKDEHNVAPSVDVPSGATPLIICMGEGHNIDDHFIFVLLRAMVETKLLHPLAVVTNHYSRAERGSLARGALDSLGLADVPIGLGGSGDDSEDCVLNAHNASYARHCTCIDECGVKLMARTLASSPDASTKILCVGNSSVLSKLLEDYEDLCSQKVEEIVILGSPKPLDAVDFIIPDPQCTSDTNDSDTASSFYQRCQHLKIPTFTVTKHVACGISCPFDAIWRSSEHLISRRKPPSSAGDGVATEERANVAQADYDNIDGVMALLCVSSSYRSIRFKWSTKQVRGVAHRVAGVSPTDNGVVHKRTLSGELETLFRLGFQSALPVAAKKGKRRRSSDSLKMFPQLSAY